MSTKESRLAYPMPLIQALGDYLLNQPMREVRPLVEALERQGVPVEVDFTPVPPAPEAAEQPAETPPAKPAGKGAAKPA